MLLQPENSIFCNCLILDNNFYIELHTWCDKFNLNLHGDKFSNIIEYFCDFVQALPVIEQR